MIASLQSFFFLTTTYSHAIKDFGSHVMIELCKIVMHLGGVRNRSASYNLSSTTLNSIKNGSMDKFIFYKTQVKKRILVGLYAWSD